MFKDGRWFWWVVAGCLSVLVADIGEVGPFAEVDQRPTVEVLGDTVDREPSVTTTTSTTVPTTSTTSTTLSEDEALEQLQGLDRDTLDALEGIKGVDPAELTGTTTP